MEQAVLTERQRKALATVGAQPELADFYLSGGTALAAYYLHHRVSDDLDFFTPREVDAISIHDIVKRLSQTIGATTVRFERVHDRYQFFFSFSDSGELKIEFTRYPFPLLDPCTEKDGLRIDSLRDIAANKLMAMLDRFDPKDFVDLYFILPRTTLTEVRKDAEVKFGARIDDLFLGGELAKARRIEALPKMLKPLTTQNLKAFFAERARELSGGIFK